MHHWLGQLAVLTCCCFHHRAPAASYNAWQPPVGRPSSPASPFCTNLCCSRCSQAASQTLHHQPPAWTLARPQTHCTSCKSQGRLCLPAWSRSSCWACLLLCSAVDIPRSRSAGWLSAVQWSWQVHTMQLCCLYCSGDCTHSNHMKVVLLLRGCKLDSADHTACPACCLALGMFAAAQHYALLAQTFHVQHCLCTALPCFAMQWPNHSTMAVFKHQVARCVIAAWSHQYLSPFCLSPEVSCS